VRFNRHALYLGAPSAQQRCPAHAAGRTEAILLEPGGAHAASAAGSRHGSPAGGSAGSLITRRGLVVTATWGRDPALIKHALALRSLSTLRSAGTPPVTATSARFSARIANAHPSPGGIYIGPGFDVCSTPSYSQMSAWSSSSYHAIGVYIGGVNMACAQPNLSPAWVSRESAAGWHLIPIYVGLQAPSNSCGCAAISRRSASSQGRAAATDAVNQAEALGMGPGNPVYLDMEAYTRGSVNTPAVLAFIGAWTAQLHSDGFKSGVYSSDDSGISDLVSEWGTNYGEPDELWIANWNGIRSTSDSNVPSSEWANHQRLHQYDGGHNETHRRVTLNIDGDYVDAATGAVGSVASVAADPSASSPPAITGNAVQGQTLTEVHGNWSNGPMTYTYTWEDCNGVGISCVEIAGATGQTYTLQPSDIGHTIRVTERASNAGGIGPPAASKPTSQVLSLVPLYWLYTSFGNVYWGPGTAWYRSPAANGFRGSTVTGMAATPDGKGYWLVDAAGKVFALGDAVAYPRLRHAHPVTGIVAAPGGGYWLYTAHGNVYPSAGTAWFRSPAANGFRGSTITGMAPTPDGKGYWLVDAAGTVFAYGDATNLQPGTHAHPVAGIAGG
jgi:hypothetical protein